MSASSRTVQATTPGMGQLVAVFAALLAGTALVVALAYGQLTASQASIAPAAAPAPAVAHDHGWSSSGATAPVTHDHGWSTSSRGETFVGRDPGWIDTTPIRPMARDSGWIDTTPIRATSRSAFDKSHHAVKRRFPLVEERGLGSNRVQFAR
jgi:hypothetical protein